MPLTLEHTPDGFKVFAGGALLAHVTARGPNDDTRGGVVKWDALPRAEWRVRFGGRPLTVAELDAVLAVLPAECGNYDPRRDQLPR